MVHWCTGAQRSANSILNLPHNHFHAVEYHQVYRQKIWAIRAVKHFKPLYVRVRMCGLGKNTIRCQR